MVALIDELQGHSIAVVSVGENGRISGFSNRCGVASDFCIAASGEEVLVANFDEDDNGYFGIASGTSFAAPLVTGGLAIMKHVFRGQLTNEQLVSRLFETANDVGQNATATEIGHLALANGASRLTIAGPQGVSAMLFQDPQQLEGLTLAWTPRTFDAFTVEAGYLNEHQSLLGSHGEGAGGRFSGETLFLGAGLNVTAGNWQFWRHRGKLAT